MGGDELTVADLSAPALDAVGIEHDLTHHVVDEELQFEAETAGNGEPQGTDAFHEALLVVLAHRNDPGQPGCDFVEGDAAADVALLAGRFPHDMGVGNLLGDRGFPGSMRPDRLALDAEGDIIGAFDVLDLLHEIGPVLEHRERVVGHVQRDTDLCGLHDVGELEITGAARTARAASEQTLDFLLDAGRRRRQCRFRR